LAPEQPVLEEPLNLDDEETQEISGFPVETDSPGMSAGIMDAEKEVAEQAEQADAGEEMPAEQDAPQDDSLPPVESPLDESLPDEPTDEPGVESPQTPPPDLTADEPSPYFPQGTYEGPSQEEPYYDYSDTTPLYEPYDRKQPEKRILGMTALQRFIVVLMVLLVILVLGTFFLMITGKIVPPIF
jgi:hypothetical protein